MPDPNSAKLKLVSGMMFAMFLFTFSGCWSSTTAYSVPTSTSIDPAKERLERLKSMMAQAAGKTAVFCISGDRDTRYRMEAVITEEMIKQGFDSYVGHLQIPSAEHYSAEELAKLLRSEGFQSVAQVTYSGDVPKDGFPSSLSFNLHALPAPRPALYSAVQTTLAFALEALIQTLIVVGAK